MFFRIIINSKNKRERERLYVDPSNMQFCDIDVKGVLLEQEPLQEINCRMLQPSPTGGGDYFMESSIFFILRSLCPKRYNKSFCKTLFMSMLSYHSQNNKLFDAFHNHLQESQKHKKLARVITAFFLYKNKSSLLNSCLINVYYFYF